MHDLAKAYEPSAVEERLYARWLELTDSYHADEKSVKPAFSIVIPPPNVTGILTMGHVLNNTLQDILCRKARMEGKEVLWLPGTDHAGLATQTKVESTMRKEEKGLTRQMLGREAFEKRVWEWTDKYGGIIIQQLKKLGCSCDWTRQTFTLDAEYSRAVLQAFVDLYNKGHIYRGKRMVNWCPASQTAISDEEVIPTPQKGKLYTIRYEVVEQPGRFLEIATTRPETLMGDTGVAVNPEDPRYAGLAGLHARRPFPEAAIPIVADAHVDVKFGTGVLKVTPAHDKADFEIGQRHNLPFLDVLTPDGKINCPEVPELHGLDRFEARKRSAEMLAERGLLAKEEPYDNTVGFSERGQVPIEPRLSEQWFLRYPKTQDALDVVAREQIKFFPRHWTKTYDHWLTNIQDWCVSRQVWWGHRIPVWYKDGDPASPKCQIASPGEGWVQDLDSLDTWASSWLWAYATMDDATRSKFYPTSVLVTGPDIIFLWVARMIIAGLEFTPGKTKAVEDNIAFENVVFTGIIRDKYGKKMSKQFGNSPDPLDLIAKYGADGLRFGLIRIAPQGEDIRFDEKQVEEGRNFCNKLWNAVRFRTMQGPIDPAADPSQYDPETHELTSFSQLLLHKLHKLLPQIQASFDRFEFSEVASALYDFVWNDFCSRFIEAAKADFQNPESPSRAGTLATLDYTLSRILRLLHPFAPFITDELWVNLGFGGPETAADGTPNANARTIQFAPWPCAEPVPAWVKDLWTTNSAEAVYAMVDAGRNLRGAVNQKVPFHLHLAEGASAPYDYEMPVLTALLNASEVTLALPSDPVPSGPFAFVPLGKLYVTLPKIDPEEERKRIEKDLAKVRKDLESTRKKLGDPNMIARAPADKVAEWRALEPVLAEKERTLLERQDALAGAV
ncbi:valine--tRNA ligase [Verrucomicrobia bacterium LW23]|nr:valine--tRNA ligase [Verrucomicrobia bacterium LW23]